MKFKINGNFTPPSPQFSSRVFHVIIYTFLSFNLSRPAPVAYSSRCDPAASAAAAGRDVKTGTVAKWPVSILRRPYGSFNGLDDPMLSSYQKSHTGFPATPLTDQKSFMM